MDHITPGNNLGDIEYSEKGESEYANNSRMASEQQYNGGNGQNGFTGYCDLFFHFMID